MIYAPDKGGSGAPIYTHNLMKGMIENGHEAGIAFSVHHSYKSTNNLPYTLHPLYFNNPPIFDNQPMATGSIPFKDMTTNQVEEYIASFYMAFEDLVETESYQLIHVQHGMYIGYAAALIKEKYKTPYFVSLHIMELNFIHEFPDPIYAMKAMTDADKILALSKSQKQRLLSEYTKERVIELDMKVKHCTKDESMKRYMEIVGEKEILSENIIICPLGIDTDMFDIRHYESYGELDDIFSAAESKIVMYAARLIEMKGIKNLLEAEKIYNKGGDVHTIVIGGGDLEEYIKSECKVRKNIHYLGFKEQTLMPMYLNFTAKNNGVFCVPSSSEGMSLVYLEAMACGTRVVASCKNDMSEMDFMQKPFAEFTEFGNIPELAFTIKGMLDRNTLNRKIIKKNMEKYNLSNFQNNMYSLYDSFLRNIG